MARGLSKELKDIFIIVKTGCYLWLGGICFPLIHAGTNKGAVSGMDASWGLDRKILLKTIAQVIGWTREKQNQKPAWKGKITISQLGVSQGESFFQEYL